MGIALNKKVRIGCVPEHFSSPLYQLSSSYDDIELVICPGGTGEMIQLLTTGKLDIIVALTEGLLASLSNNESRFKLIGTYVSSPLTWSVATHPDKKPHHTFTAASDASQEELESRWEILKDSKIGVSRFGSGSHLIPFVMADRMGWLDSNKKTKSDSGSVLKGSGGDASVLPFEFVVQKDIHGLRNGIVSKETDAFLWERFTTKPYYDSGELYHFTSVTPPWSAFMLAASTDFIKSDSSRLAPLLEKITKATSSFAAEQNRSASIDFIHKKFGYNVNDVDSWFKTVRYPQNARQVSEKVVWDCVGILRKAGLVGSEMALRDVSVGEFVDINVAMVVA
ncbi:hypothetical protein HK098_005072 [Nowakowskiella sp. JEL0407]|nr:hypothetical protein HK098_005072 [Nowakowskiella sp. JEL0407]